MDESKEQPEGAAADEGEAAKDAAGGQGGPRTFTKDEVDAIVRRRVDRQNAKHNEEVEALTRRVGELEAAAKQAADEKERIEREREAAGWRAEAAKETGVPADLLRGSTAEEVMGHAQAIKAAMGRVPRFPDSGHPTGASANDARSSFDAFMKTNFGK